MECFSRKAAGRAFFCVCFSRKAAERAFFCVSEKKTEMIRNQLYSGFSREFYCSASRSIFIFGSANQSLRCGKFSFELLVAAVFIEMKFIENWSFPDKRKLSSCAELSCLKFHWKEQTKSFSGNISFFLYTGILVC